MPKEPRRVPTVLGRVQNGLVPRPRGSFLFRSKCMSVLRRWLFLLRYGLRCRRTAEIDSRSPAARSALFTAMCAGLGILDSRPSHCRRSLASATVNRPWRCTGIPPLAQRCAMFTGRARKSAIAFQPRSWPSLGVSAWLRFRCCEPTVFRRGEPCWIFARSRCFFIGTVRVHLIARRIRDG